MLGLAQAQICAGNYTAGFRQEGNNVFFSTTHAAVKLEFCTPEMFRVRPSFFHTAYPSAWEMGLGNSHPYFFSAGGPRAGLLPIQGPKFPQLLQHC